MKLEMMVDDCVVGVIQFEEVFERSRLLFVLGLDIVDGDSFNIYR